MIYHQPETFRDGRLVIMIGHPVRVDDTVGTLQDTPALAVRRLTKTIAGSLRALLVEASDRDTFELLEFAHALWHTKGADPFDARAWVVWMQRALRGYRYLAATGPAHLARVRDAMERYRTALARAKCPAPMIAVRDAAGAVMSIACGIVVLLITLPLGCAGLLLHALPYQLTRRLVRSHQGDPDMEATMKLSIATVCYPPAWFIEMALAGWIGGAAVCFFVAASLVPTGVAVLLWGERARELLHELRALAGLHLAGSWMSELVQNGLRLRESLIGLATSVPESVLTGEQSS